MPENVKQALRVKAAEKGRSLEDALRRLVAEETADPIRRASEIDADEIMRRAAELEQDPPIDGRFQHYSEKELSDVLCGVYDDLL